MTMPTPTWGSSEPTPSGLGAQPLSSDLSFMPPGYEPVAAMPAAPTLPSYTPYTTPDPYPAGPSADPYAGAGYPPAGQPGMYAEVPYQAQYYPPVGYGMAPYAAAAPLPSGMAVTSMVLGIASFVIGMWLFPLPITALILGVIALGKANRGEASGKGMAIAGIVLGSIATLGGLALIAFYVLMMANM